MFVRHGPLAADVTDEMARSFPPLRVNPRPGEGVLACRFVEHHLGFNPTDVCGFPTDEAHRLAFLGFVDLLPPAVVDFGRGAAEQKRRLAGR